MDPKTYLVLLHLLGLVVGLGSVTTLDFYLLKFVRGDTVTRSDAHLVHLVSLLAAAGLAALWVSGIGFLIMAWFDNPALLGSPKVQAKLIVVAILTINGAVLHFKVLPQIERAVGRPLFCKSSSARSDRIMMRVCGAVSAASWWTPFILGTVRELNYAAPIWAFLAGYVVLLGLFGAGFTVVEHFLSTRLGHRAVHDPAPLAAASPQLDAGLYTAGLTSDRATPSKEEPASAMREEKSFGAYGGDADPDTGGSTGELRRRADDARTRRAVDDDAGDTRRY